MSRAQRGVVEEYLGRRHVLAVDAESEVLERPTFLGRPERREVDGYLVPTWAQENRGRGARRCADRRGDIEGERGGHVGRVNPYNQVVPGGPVHDPRVEGADPCCARTDVQAHS